MSNFLPSSQAFPGFTPCTWLTTLRRDDLIERAGAVRRESD
jgi:mRNA interferase MazF